uniref:Anaphase-promoting complex subunit 4 WD40 domain-containing protein n=1 Tax=Calcidiscus leptoporus TaxID=127549 RepID=A0A7S0IYN5_9EUKA|mmetsp:Transcript_290/g.642  ORF Transcript_290/g.642 Transcript_290/m.642 type:complete len:303 (+) Transcript_290:16-924(+)
MEAAATLRAHKGGVHALAFNSDGMYCMSAGDDRRVLLWNPRREDATPIKEYTGHSNRVLDIAIAPDNGSFASCGGDRTVFVWDVPSGRVTRRLQGHTQRVNAVTYNAEGSVLVSASYDTSVRCWDCRSRSAAPIQVLSESADSVTCAAVGQHEIFTSSVDGVLRCYDLRAGLLSCDAVGVVLTHVALSQDGNCALVASLDSTLRLFDKSTGQLLCSYKGHENSSIKLSCSLSFDDAHVLSGSEDGNVHMWDLVEGRQIAKYRGHKGAVAALVCDPKRLEVLTASYDGDVKLWGQTSGPLPRG